MVAKLYCVTSADKTKLNGVYFQVTCTFELVAIWPIALIGRLRFLFLSLIFLIRTSAKAYFCLAPSSPPPSSSSPPPSPPFVPRLRCPYGIVRVEHIFLPRHPTRDKNATKDRHCAVRARESWVKKVVFPCHNNQNTWRHFVELLLTENFKSLIYQKKILSSKAFLFVKNQTLNKALLAKIHRPTKNITPTVAHRGHAIHFLNSILSRDKRETC